ncbi:hypothetical protein GCM10010211_58230 [Streptomyces albospinus]|uniref:Uncharacterized protein n=1 Tax=Streptomyces albospinus TaxID=285515 RepID=A0ABQ2VFP2_9ACTN|nr:hypothetical protein GCM10010211_58230 [Streptomyces albospinus]
MNDPGTRRPALRRPTGDRRRFTPVADSPSSRTRLASVPDRIRIPSAYLHTPVFEAFDAVLHTATSTVAGNLEIT